MRRPGGEKTYLTFSKAASPEEVAARAPVPRRCAPFSLRLSEQERADLTAQADGEPLGTYIKSRLFTGAAYRTRAKRVDREALGKLLGALGQSRISQNLNQIAKAANIGALPVTPELMDELHGTCAELKSLRQDIMAALGLRGS